MTTTVPASMIGAFVTPETYGAIGNVYINCGTGTSDSGSATVIET